VGCGSSGKTLLGTGGVGAGGSGGGGSGGAGNRVTGTIAGTINRDVDILFLIDDSSEMTLQQTNLINNFPTFMTTLQSAPQGLPNLHIAVVSQDMGAGDGTIAGCNATSGDQGIFRYVARGTCTTTNLQQGATFISNIGGQANYTGSLADVFACIARLGETGCGFEHPFAAILRALGADGQPAPAENAGFLRPDAYLAIVILTNEDDCSASPGNGPNGRLPLFDTAANNDMASQLGPPQNFRCNEFGHTCPTGVLGSNRVAPHPDRNAPNNDVTATVDYDGCMSDDVEGYLLPVHATATALKQLKTDPSMVFVTAITGPATPYQVKWRNPSTADRSCGAASCPWPEMTHSCVATDGSFADPGVRNAQLAGEFGANGQVLSICDSSYAPALSLIAQKINATLGPPCIAAQIALDPKTGDPDCKITQHEGTVDKTVPACADNGGAPPCWQLMAGGPTCNGQTLSISFDPNMSASAASFSYDCGRCVAGMTDPARGCP